MKTKRTLASKLIKYEFNHKEKVVYLSYNRSHIKALQSSKSLVYFISYMFNLDQRSRKN